MGKLEKNIKSEIVRLSDTQWAALFAIVVTGVWMAIGLGYFVLNSKSRESRIFPFPGKERPENKNTKYSIVQPLESGQS